MRKKILLLICVLTCCFVLLACGTDIVCGKWGVYSFAYLYNGVTYEYSLSEAKQLEENIDVMSHPEKYTDQEIVEGTIGYMYNTLHNTMIIFNSNKTVDYIMNGEKNTTLTWERQKDNIVVKGYDEYSQDTIYSFEDDDTIYTEQTYSGNTLTIILKRN